MLIKAQHTSQSHTTYCFQILPYLDFTECVKYLQVLLSSNTKLMPWIEST